MSTLQRIVLFLLFLLAIATIAETINALRLELRVERLEQQISDLAEASHD